LFFLSKGLHTKIAQVAAFELGIPLDQISVKNTNNLVNPNCLFTGGSVSTELCAKVNFYPIDKRFICLKQLISFLFQSVLEACKILKARLEPFRKEMPENYTWPELIARAFSRATELSAMYQTRFENIFLEEYKLFI